MGLPPDLNSQIKQKQEELSELLALRRSLCDHLNINHHGWNNDGG